MKKLLITLEKALVDPETPLFFMGHQGIDKEVKTFAESYQWPFGPKKLVIDEQALSLDDNIRKCGDLALLHEAVIILEDDLRVSPFFYSYTKAALRQYEENPLIASIGLYRYASNPVSGYPKYFVHPPSDAYFIQKTVTWGQCFTKNQWQHFRNWLETKTKNPHKLPHYMRHYGANNWEWQHNLYLLSTGRYVSQPAQSLTTNTGQPGTHHKTRLDAGRFQVTLQWAPKDYHFPSWEQAGKYDAYFEPDVQFLKRLLPPNSDLLNHSFTCDLQGIKPLSFLTTEYTLTAKPSANPILSYSNELLPLELNLINEHPGSEITLTRTADILLDPKFELMHSARQYFGHAPDIGWRKWLRYKWLMYVDRKRNK